MYMLIFISISSVVLTMLIVRDLRSDLGYWHSVATQRMKEAVIYLSVLVIADSVALASGFLSLQYIGYPIACLLLVIASTFNPRPKALLNRVSSKVVKLITRRDLNVETHDAFDALKYLTTYVELANVFVSNELEATTKNILDYWSESGKRPPDDLQATEAKNLISSLVIDKDLLYFLSDRIGKSQERYKKCLRCAKSPGSRYVCDQELQRNVCEWINRILDKNNGKFPSDDLSRQWKACKCKRY